MATKKKSASTGRTPAKKGSRAKTNQTDDLLAAAAAASPTSEIEPTVDESLFEPLPRRTARLDEQPEIRAARRATPVVEVNVDESHQVILERIAQAEGEHPEMQTNPLTETINDLKSLLPDEGRGMSFRCLSERITARKGRRNWQPLLHPVTGKEIKIQGQTLCWMPKVAATRRNRHYQEIGNEQIREATENFRDRMREITGDAEKQGIHGYSVLDQDDVVTSNDRRQSAIANLGRRAQMGVSVSRGELREPQAAARFDGDSEAAIEREVQRRLAAMEGAEGGDERRPRRTTSPRQPQAANYQPGEYAGLGRE
jgi:hypothetical protein